MKLSPFLFNGGYQLLMFGARKASLTPSEFRDYYEQKHIPFMQNLTGATFPLSHVRHYIQRDGAPDYLAQLLPGGQQADFDFDVVAVLTYRDEEHFQENWAFFENEETARLIREDEANFSGPVRGVVLGETKVTLGGERP
jgi:hypothetical protein